MWSQVTMCTDMACFRQGTPFCTMFADGTACRDSDCSAAHAAGSKATAPTGACSTDADCGAGFCRKYPSIVAIVAIISCCV